MSETLRPQSGRKSRSVIGFALIFALGAAARAAAQQVVISEFMASNGGTLLDEDLASPDWIEIENGGTTAVDLTGWHLTDDATNPGKWTFPAVQLAAGTRLVVFASGKNKTNPAGNLHTNFSLSDSGEYLALTKPNLAVASEYAPAYPAQINDVSYGIPAGGGAPGWFDVPTPGGPNGSTSTLMPPVGFSMARGVYYAPIDVSLSCTMNGARIKYTTDGSEPSQTNGLLFTGAPVHIATTTTLRAVAYLSAGPSINRSVTYTYIFPQDVFGQSQAGAVSQGFPAHWIEQDGVSWTVGAYGPHPDASYGMDTTVTSAYTTQELTDALLAIPSVSLVMSKDDWFGYNAPNGPFGIYVNSEEESDGFERKCSAEYIDPNGGQFQINCGVSIQGGSSTYPDYRGQLSMQMKFKSQWGPSKLEFPIFPGSSVQRFDRLILDGGNQDGIYSIGGPFVMNHHANVRDRFSMDLLREMGGATSRGRYVHVFINGLYWGIYDLHERPDENWAAEYYGGADDQYDWVKQNGVYSGNNNGVGTQTAGAWHVLTDVAVHGLGPNVTYQGQDAYSLFSQYVDVPNYIDYLLLNFYLGNNDWPDHNWMASARARVGPAYTDVNPDMKFRFHAWDTEHCVFWSGVETIIGDGFYDLTVGNWTYPGPVTYFHSQAKANPDYMMLFADRAHKALFNDGPLYVAPGFDTSGTPYDPAHPERNRPASLFYPVFNELSKAVPLQYARWANYFYQPGSFTPAVWFAERTRILNEWCAFRSKIFLAQLKNAGLYPSVDAPTFNQYGGQITPGFQLVISGPQGATIYYTLDGSDPRLPGGAVNPAASIYSGPIMLTQSKVVNARAFQNATWSALNGATFNVDFALRISEFMADNTNTIKDEAGQYEDWVELYNASGVPLNLTGVYLSDSPANPLQWAIPAGTVLQPGDHLLVWCDDQASDGPYHANFKLSKGGESVVATLKTQAGNVTLDAITFGPQSSNVSTGRLPGGTGEWFSIIDPSPGAENVPAPGHSARYDALNPSETPTALSIITDAKLNQTLSIQLQGALPNAPGVVFFGLGASVLIYPGIGTFLVAPILDGPAFYYTTTAVGTSLTSFVIPNSPALLNISFATQALTIPQGLSNAVAFTVGQ